MEVFDYDLQRELARHDEKKCSICGYVGEVFEFEEGCPECQWEDQPNEFRDE